MMIVNSNVDFVVLSLVKFVIKDPLIVFVLMIRAPFTARVVRHVVNVVHQKILIHLPLN